MRILLLGKDGQVGRALHPTLAPLGELVALGRAEADFERPGELARVVAAHAPDVIVNAAAYTAVDKAESDADRARLINAEAVAALATEARRIGAWLVHYSTDYVYDGQKSVAYVETDPSKAMYVGAAMLGGALGTSVTNKKAGMLFGVGLGLLFAALLDPSSSKQ